MISVSAYNVIYITYYKIYIIFNTAAFRVGITTFSPTHYMLIDNTQLCNVFTFYQ